MGEGYRVRHLEGPKYCLFLNVQTGSAMHPAPIQWLVEALTPGVKCPGSI